MAIPVRRRAADADCLRLCQSRDGIRAAVADLDLVDDACRKALLP